jgi:uncharacterized protein (TIGR02145 family)
MKRILLFSSVFLFLFSCQENNLFTTINKEITSEYLKNGSLDVYLSNNQILRYKGKPGIQMIQIGNVNLSNYEYCFVLHVATGTTQATIVSSAIIKLDGLEVLNTSDFSKNMGQYTFEICNLLQTSVLTVEVRGEPGSYIDLWIEGKLKGLTVTDCDGNIYKTVKIGTQVWMKENLKVTKFNDCIEDIPLVTDETAWAALSTPGYSWYDNDAIKYKDTYGALYNWYAVNTAKLCPTGWHVPTHNEWKILELNLGMSQEQVDETGGWSGTIEGGMLKEEGTEHWLFPNSGATNVTGFTALPGGDKYSDGSCYMIGYTGYWWTATEYSPTYAWFRALFYELSNVATSKQLKTEGYSVRCVKDNM